MIRRLLALSGPLALSLVSACETPSAPREVARSADAAAPARSGPLDLMGGGEGTCEGEAVTLGGQRFLRLTDGSLVTRAPLAVRTGGAARAYHPDGFAAGAIRHRCNAGEVHLPDGSRYMGGASEAACERFERDAARIEAAGWTDGSVGAIRWFGIDAEGSARVAGRLVPRARPVVGPDGFYVSRTALRDEDRPAGDPDASPDALGVPYAATRRDQGIALGSHGVAWRVRSCPPGRACEPVPFVVADRAPRAGAGSIALARRTSGLPEPEGLSRRTRYRGQTDAPDLLTVFFAGEGAPFDVGTAEGDAEAAFAAWGGRERLLACRRVFVPTLNE